MMKPANVLLPVVLVVVGFMGARIVSEPPSSDPAEERDPVDWVKATKLVRTPPSGGGAKIGFEATVNKLSRVEMAFARGDFASLMDGEHANDAASAWATADPEGLWTWIQENGGNFWGNLYGRLFVEWFRRDPDAAIDALRKTRSGRYDGQFSLMELVFDEDPEVARAAGERIDEFIGEARPDPGEPADAHFTQGRETVEKLMALPESHAKEKLLRYAMAGWFKTDWRAARSWAAGRTGAERATMERSLFALGLPGGIKRDSEGVAWALEWLGRNENRDLRAALGHELASVIAKDDPAEAMTWASTQLSGASMARAMAAAVASQMRLDQEAAIATVDALPPGGVRQQAGRALVSAMMAKDPHGAVERALSDQRFGYDVGAQSWGRLGSALANQKPDVLRALLTEPPEGLSPVFERRGLDVIGRRDPGTTLDWAANLDGERGAKITKQVLSSWRRQDPEAAEKWESGRGVLQP